MPKQAEPHFDAPALLGAVQLQQFGVRVSTNNPAGLRRILYAAMRKDEALRCRIYQCPRSRNAFLLCKAPIPSAVELAEQKEEASNVA